jgi:single-stranded-DNA-specific exonuclease
LKEEKIWQFNFKNNLSSQLEMAEIASEFNINPKILSVLANRGVKSRQDINKFLYGGLEYIHNPFLFEDMYKAADRIRQAIDLKEQILIYGDRDVDGITAVNIMVNTLKALGGNVWWYVPAEESYRVHKDILIKYAQEKVKLLITVDCGISAKEELDYAKTLGMDIILTDHHEPISKGLPSGVTAIINSKLQDTSYPFKDIAGCVVALKTVWAVNKTFDKDYNKTNLFFLLNDIDDNQTLTGSYSLVKNDLKIQDGQFNSLNEFKQLLNDCFKIYTFDCPALKTLLQKDILLKDKIELLESKNTNNNSIDDLIHIKIAATNRENPIKDFFENNLDLCTLGIIADSMPLIDENRIIVREGLKLLSSNPSFRPGLALLLDDTLKLRDSYKITCNQVSWNITPVLNSAGRMGRGMLSVQLLMTKDFDSAQNLYTDIIKLNNERKNIQFTNIEQFKILLKEQYNPETDKVIILIAENSEHGVTGIVSSLIAREHSKPAFLLISNGREAIGAARTANNFNIIDALENVNDLLDKYGGHSQAAGFTIAHSNIGEFKKRIQEYSKNNIVEQEVKSIISIEGELKISDINYDFYKQIQSLAPFGMANPIPIFCMKSVNATEVCVFGSKNEHLKFKVSQKGSRNVQAVFWNHAYLADNLKKDDFYNIVFSLEATEKNGSSILQLIVIDIRETIDCN